MEDIVLIYKKGDKTNPPQHPLSLEWKTTALKAWKNLLFSSKCIIN
jgi:hypothetical protein